MGPKMDDSAAVELTGKIMVVAIIVLFLVVLFVFFLHLYAKWFWYRRDEDGPAAASTTTRRRRRFDFSPGHEELSPATALVRLGLDPSVLKSIPVLKFNSKDFKEGLECAVCLSELADGEKARLLPKCNHGFHVECIDMWFQSHSTCPLCRNPVSNQLETSLETILENQRAEENSSSVNVNSNSTMESPNFPTNVLFWGNENQVSTMGACLDEEDHHPISSQIPCSSSSSSSSSTSNRGDGELVIDIPRQMNEEEDTKSPMPTRMRSLKRLLSRDRRVNPCSPSNVDLEQVGRAQT